MPKALGTKVDAQAWLDGVVSLDVGETTTKEWEVQVATSLQKHFGIDNVNKDGNANSSIPHEDEIKHAIETGHIQARSPLDSKFRREHGPGNPEEQKAWKACKTPQEKAVFKKKWAKLDFKTGLQKHSKTASEVLKKKDIVEGRMLTFGGWSRPTAGGVGRQQSKERKKRRRSV